MSQSSSVLDPFKDYIIELADNGMSNSDIVKTLYATHGFKTTESSLRRAYHRWNYRKPVVEKSGFKSDGDKAEIVSKPYASAKPKNKEERARKVAEMLEERGEKADDWVIDSYGVNEWTGPNSEGGTNTYKQTKATLKRKKPVELMLPGRVPLPYSYNASPRFKHDGDEPERVLFLPDPQVPSHDTELHKRVQELIVGLAPHRIVLLGDLGDFPDISRHPDKPELEATVQQVGDGVVLYLHEIRSAYDEVGGGELILLAGNHDERVRKYQIEKAAKLYGVTPGKLPWEARLDPLLTIQKIYRLDEFGVNYIDPKGGDYEHEQYIVSQNLAAAHGWIAQQKSGASALKTLEHTGFSIVIGHTHRQSLVFKTFHDIHKNPYTLAACEAGTLAQVRGGLQYARNADWQAGLAAASVYEDQTFNIDLGSYVEGKLYFRDKRY